MNGWHWSRDQKPEHQEKVILQLARKDLGSEYVGEAVFLKADSENFPKHDQFNKDRWLVNGVVYPFVSGISWFPIPKPPSMSDFANQLEHA